MISGKNSGWLNEAAIALELHFCNFRVESLRVIETSKDLALILGYRPESLQGMTLDTLLRPEDVAGFRAALNGLDENFKDVGLWNLRRQSGEWLPVEMRARSVKDGEETSVVVIIRDASRLFALQRERDEGDRRLAEEKANLRMAQELLDVGIWKLDMVTGRMNWSENVYHICGLKRDVGAPDFAGLVAMFHPEDRAGMAAEAEAFMRSEERTFEFRHRIVRPDGRTVHVRGIAERRGSGDDAWLTGVLQDITDEVRGREELSKASRMQRIAGRAARLGGWRIKLNDGGVDWSPETAAIHGKPIGFSPSLEEAINYYAPEHRARISEAFDACARHGRPFDEVLQLVTAQGNRVWVRAIGEAVRDESHEIVAVEGAIQDISELVAARDESEALSRRLRDTLESISDAFYLLDSDWRFLFMNKRAEELLARRREDLLKKAVWEEFPETVGTSIEQNYLRAIESGKPVRFRDFYRPLETWFQIDAEPTPDGLAVYFRDVTQEHVREEQLRLLETAVSRQSDILLITEAEPIDAPDGPKIIYVNEAFVRRTGYSREEAIGATPRIVQGPRTDRDELDRIRRALERWQPVRSELINYTKSGEEFWIELDIVPIADETGWFTHWVSVERDITERKRVEEEIRLYQERFRLVTRATTDIIWDWDLVADTQWCNENLKILLGYDPTKTEQIVESWANRVHPEDRESVVASMDAVLEGSDTFWSGEYRYRHADGHYLTFIDRTFVIRDDEGKAIRMLGSLVDVTNQRELENRLRQAQKLEAVGQLTGGVAHDFNNLLTVILGNAEMLADGLGDHEEMRRLADMTVMAAERGAELTNRLLAFSRKQALQPQVVDVGALIHDMESLLRRTLPESIDIRLVQSGRLWRAEIDPNQLEAALLNVTLNARDAMPGGGHLTIEMTNAVLDDDYAADEQELVPGQYVMIAVTDTGHGMPVDVLRQVFEPFFTTKEVGKGTGLGLSMVYGFVKQTGGHIRVYSEPGEGTCVRLYFPRSYELDVQPRFAAGGPAITGGTETILAVEDDAMVREHLVARLDGLGYKVSAAETGPQAIALLEEMPDLDLLLTDIVLPGGMNGRALADAALALRPDLKVLFTSGYSENAIVHHGRLDLGVELLSKPYRREQLAEKVRKVLDGR